jgi:hypothetical protein
LISLAGRDLELSELFIALSVLGENVVIPAPFVDVANEGTPEGGFGNVGVSESISNLVLGIVAEAEGHIWDVPGTP